MLDLAPFKAYPFYLSPDPIHGGMFAGFYRYFSICPVSGGGKMFLKFENGGISKYKSWRLVTNKLDICPIGILEQGVKVLADQTGEMLGPNPNCLLGLCRQVFDDDAGALADHGLCVLFLDKIEVAMIRQIMAQPSAAGVPKNAYLPFQMNIIRAGATPTGGFRRGAIKSHENDELWWLKLARENRLEALDEEKIRFVEQVKEIYYISPI